MCVVICPECLGGGSRMDNSVGDIPHCEEQLRTTLHCDDKEKVLYLCKTM